MRIKKLAYIKTVRSNGSVYLYFDTGETDARGKIRYERLPDKKDIRFGSVYAAFLGQRTRRAIGSLTVSKLVEMYHGSSQFEALSQSTKKMYRIYQGKFAEKLPTAPAGKVDRSDIILLFDTMAQTPGAANLMLSSVGALYAWARERGHVANRPTDDIERNELGEYEPWPDELVNLALTCNDQLTRLATHLLLYTAQRIGDICSMRWQQVGDGIITVRQQKTRKDLTLPLHPELQAELARWPRDLRTIMIDDKGRAYTTNRLRLHIQAWADRLGYKIVPHGLRKNAVNALLEAGCTVAETASISGQSLKLVEHYAKRRDQSKLARSAMLKWAGTQGESGKDSKNSTEKGQ